MVYLIKLFSEFFGYFSILFFISVIFYITGAKDMRLKISGEIGYKPSINSNLLWFNIKKEYKENKKFKQAYCSGLFARFLFFLMWLSILSQMIIKDVN